MMTHEYRIIRETAHTAPHCTTLHCIITIGRRHRHRSVAHIAAHIAPHRQGLRQHPVANATEIELQVRFFTLDFVGG